MKTFVLGAIVLVPAASFSVQVAKPNQRPAEKVSAWRGPANLRVVASNPPANPNSETELRSRLAKNDKDLQTRVALAVLLQKKNDFAGMVEVLRPASDNLARKGMLLLAVGYHGKKDYLNQVRVLELLIAQNRKDYYVQNALGEAYISLGKKDEALDKFQEARKLNVQFLPAYKNLLAIYSASGEKYEARNLLTDMIRVFGPRPEFYHELCKLYSVDGFLEKSSETCRLAIQKQPSFAPSHMYYAQTLWDQEKKDDALRVLKQAAKQFQKSEDVQDAAGEMTYNVGDFINSFKYFTQCTKIYPKSSKCQLGYSKSAFALQKYPEALSGFSALCRLDNSSLGEFRKAASNLRQKNEYVWATKYDTGLNSCSAIR